MNTQEILTIIAMAALGLCLVLAFSKGMTKNLKTKESMTHVCSLLVVIAVALLAVTQFLSDKKENMDWEIGTVATSSMPNDGRAKKGGGKVSMGQMESSGTCCPGYECSSGPSCDYPGGYCAGGYSCFSNGGGGGGGGPTMCVDSEGSGQTCDTSSCAEKDCASNYGTGAICKSC
jgi:hypothetical protein